MSKVKETMILFGRTIHLFPNNTDLASSHQNHPSTTTSHHLKITTQSNQGESARTEEVFEHANEDPTTPNLDEETTNLGAPRTLSENSENHETSSISKENSLPDTNDTSTISDETLRKPDELLPCPRCRSMDTKFCYYNNYNVSQPRHFCKKCQRYWTAGGTMRNVPVGSGRRKNKCSPASQYRQIIFSESVQAARAGAANGINQLSGSLLAFGSDSPQYKYMPSAEIHEVKSERYVKNRCSGGNDSRIPNGSQETDDDNSSKSSRSPNSMGLDIGFGSISKNIQEATVQVPCFPVPLWASPWNTAEWRASTEQPAFGLAGSFYPTQPYCPTPDTWNMQCLAPQCELSVTSPCPNSRTLGKRSRDESVISLSNPEKVKQEVMSPKALRIHDQSEAAQSCIWLTLGIESDDTDSVNEARLQKAFRSKGVENNHMRKASMLLQANPAALHRSFTFQEAI